ncbi:MAG: hypothetical protein ABIR33_07915 [Pyrinomonadaceae bacterium]
MAANVQAIRRPSDRGLMIAAAAVFPLLVLAGYFRSYYARPFFNNPPFANSLVHFHAIVMTIWVLYFTAQIVLVRTKNLKLHMTMGLSGTFLAAVVIIVGMVTAWDSHIVRGTAPPGMSAHSFFLVPVLDMLFFAIFFAGAIYYRKKPAQHKGLMLMTAINFSPAAIARLPIFPPDLFIIQALAFPALLGLTCFAWHTWKYRKFNWVFAIALFAFIASGPLRVVFAGTQTWLGFVGWLASFQG